MDRRGFTLHEVLTAVIIIGVLATLALPQYNRTLERSRWRASRDILEAIYAGEQVYATLNANTYCNPALPPGPPPACPNGWISIYVDNPATGPLPVAFAVSLPIPPAPATSFTATATSAGSGACSAWTLSLDQSHTYGGANPTVDTVCP